MKVVPKIFMFSRFRLSKMVQIKKKSKFTKLIWAVNVQLGCVFVLSRQCESLVAL